MCQSAQDGIGLTVPLVVMLAGDDPAGIPGQSANPCFYESLDVLLNHVKRDVLLVEAIDRDGHRIDAALDQSEGKVPELRVSPRPASIRYYLPLFDTARSCGSMNRTHSIREEQRFAAKRHDGLRSVFSGNTADNARG
jgi:hypothetical protein